MVLLYILPYRLSGCSSEVLNRMIDRGTLVLPQFQFPYLLLITGFPAVVNALIFRDMSKGVLQKKMGTVCYCLMEKRELLCGNLISALLIILLPFFVALTGAVFTLELPKMFLLEFFVVSFIDALFFLAVSFFIAVTIKGVIPQILVAVSVFLLPLLADFILLPWLEKSPFGADLGMFHTILSQSAIFRMNQNIYRFSIPCFFANLIVSGVFFRASAVIFTKWEADNGKGCVRYSALNPVYRTLFMLFLIFISIFAAKQSLTVFLFCLFFSYILFALLFE